MKEFPCWMKDTYNYLLPAMLKSYASGDDVLGDWISSCIRELSDIAQLLETKGED